jgi:cysteine-rich repeat protein
MRAASLALTMALAAAAGSACSMSSANPLYCDSATPCQDPALPRCDLVAHQCMPADDAGAPPDGAAPDGPLPDGALPDGPLPDGPLSDGPPPDGGCGTCPASTPICDPGTGACRTCTAHAECLARNAAEPVCTAGTCHPNRCGDRYVDTSAGERCDDGNTDNGDGCDPTCRYTGTVTTIAGHPGSRAQVHSFCDDAGRDARLADPRFIAPHGDGSLFFTECAANVVRQVSLPTWSTRTLAGKPFNTGSGDGTGATALFSCPTGIAADATYVYVADRRNYTIRRITIGSGTVTTVAGQPGQSGSSDGTGQGAHFGDLGGMVYTTAPGTAVLYVADNSNNSIRRVDINDTGAFPVTTHATFAGGCGPRAVAVSADGTLYVACEASLIVKVDTSGTVTTEYGQLNTTGSADGQGTNARFAKPAGVVLKGTPATGEILYVADDTNRTIRKIDLGSKQVSTLAGTAGVRGLDDGIGSSAKFATLHGIAMGGSLFGNDLIVAQDESGSVLRRITQSTGTVTTPLGTGGYAGAIDGAGSTARFFAPAGIAPQADGLLVADWGNCTLRHVASPGGEVTTLAGSAGHCSFTDGVGTSAEFIWPYSLLTHGASVFVGDLLALREVDPSSKTVTSRAGDGTAGMQDGSGSGATFTGLASVASDSSSLYVADNCTIRKITLGAPWTVTTIFGQPGECTGVDGVAPQARLGTMPAGLLVVNGVLYVADATNSALRAVDLSASPLHLTTVAGTLGIPGTRDGVGSVATFTWPSAVAFDGQSLFVFDENTVRQVDLATMRVSTLVGRPACYSAIDGDFSRAALNRSFGLTYNPTTKSLFVADTWEDVVREIR